MAFEAMEKVRLAEQDVERRIQEALTGSDESIAQAKITYESIISSAKKDVETMLLHSSDKASAKAEEIIVTARNNALLEAEKLKNQCTVKQDAVNKAILELIL